MKEVRAMTKKRFKCPLCPHVSRSAEGLWAHLYTEHLKKDLINYIMKKEGYQ